MKKSLYAVSVAGLLCLAPFAQAGQHPNAAERAALETVLTNAGYVSWGEIEQKKDYWDVDDARKELGASEKFDLKLDMATLEIVKEKKDR